MAFCSAEKSSSSSIHPVSGSACLVTIDTVEMGHHGIHRCPQAVEVESLEAHLAPGVTHLFVVVIGVNR